MKKKIFVLVVILAALLLGTSAVLAEDNVEYVDGIPKDSHKIKNKWDAIGTYISDRDLSSALVGRTWTYEIHIKQAMYGPYSKGVILLTSGDDVITAHVEDVKENYSYWSGTSLAFIQENFAAVGWAELNDQVYNFMFLYCEGGLWILLSDYSYDTRWAAGDVYQGVERGPQVLLSNEWPPESAEFLFDPKEIH